MSAAAKAAAGGGGGGGGPAKPKTNYGSATSAGGALAAFAAYDKDGDGKIDANELLTLDTDGDGVVTEEEIAEVLRRMKALGNVPQHAAQRIAFLDKDMAALRVKREKMAVAIAREEAALARVLADEAGALAQLTALEEGNKARREQRQGLLGAIARAEKQVAAFVSGVASTKRDVVYNVVESDQRAASRALEEARGYSTGVVNKMHGDGVTVFATKASATALAKAGAASTLQSAV